MVGPEQEAAASLLSKASIPGLPAELAHQALSLEQKRLGRRRYLVVLAAESCAGQPSASDQGPCHEEHVILLTSRPEGILPVGSLCLAARPDEKGLALEASGLVVPGDPWHADGAITERGLLLLHGACRVAKTRQAAELWLLAAPGLLANLISASERVRLVADRPSPDNLLWAVADLQGPEGRGFDAVLFGGRGLERLARFGPGLV
jgi:hypothetical protein